jgi:hypothetical protein
MNLITQNEVTEVQSKKLVRLYGGPILQKQNRDSVVNLSNVELDQETVNVLSYGMNCHLRTKTDINRKKIEIEKLYSCIKDKEHSEKVTIEDNERLKGELKVFGLRNGNRDFNKDVLNKEQYLKLKELREDNRVIVRKADKSNVFVVMNRDDYCEKMNTIISDETKFEKINVNPILTIKREVNKYVTSINAVAGGPKFKKLVGHYEPAYIHIWESQNS